MQEEETALLSLGAVLEWEAVTPGVLERARLGPQERRQCYSVTVNPDRSTQVCVEVSYYLIDSRGISAWRLPGPKHEELTPYHWYLTVTEAKAACEVHAATGQFPTGVESA